jgi:MoaA/NifB/PqqE/SkfB family radical SAM enzyme
LMISLDGGREVHDGNRGEGSWAAAVHAIEVARGVGTPVQLLSTVSRLTTGGLSDVYEIAEKYDCGVTFDLMAPLYDREGGWEVRKEAASDEQIRRLLDYLIAHPSPRSVFNSRVLRYVRDWPFSYRKYRIFKQQLPGGFKPIPCAAGRFFGLIETDGSLLPCCRTGPEYDPPNVYRLGVEEAWRKMPAHSCAACVQIGGNMFNSIFSLHPGTLLHYLITSLRLPTDRGWKK